MLLIYLHPELAASQKSVTSLVKLPIMKIKLLTNRLIPLIHLSALIAKKNGLADEEWPNIEFYPLKDVNHSDFESCPDAI